MVRIDFVVRPWLYGNVLPTAPFSKAKTHLDIYVAFSPIFAVLLLIAIIMLSGSCSSMHVYSTIYTLSRSTE